MVNKGQSRLSDAMAADEGARARIAADIHDDTIQTLGAVALSLQNARDGTADADASAALDAASWHVRDAANRLRRVMFELMPPLSATDLRGALQAYCDVLFAGSGMECEVEHSARRRRPAVSAASGPDQVSVVVADDHPLFLGALKSTVESCGGLTLLADATDGQQALEMIRLHRPDVAVLDMRMPKLDGREVMRRLREEEPVTRVLFISEYIGGELVLQALTAGAAGYLPKSSTPDESATRSSGSPGASRSYRPRSGPSWRERCATAALRAPI